MRKVLTRRKLISLQCYMYMPNSFKINENFFFCEFASPKKKTNKQTNKQKKKQNKNTRYNLVLLSMKDKMYKVWNFQKKEKKMNHN